MDQSSTQIFPFLSLSPEIRNQIYGYLLSTKYTKRVLILGPECASPIPLVKLCPSHYYEFHTTILELNRQVYQEGTSILYCENLFIRLVTNVKQIQRLCYNVGLQPLLYGKRAKDFKESAMSITISQDGNNRKGNFFQIYACEDLHLLCRGLLACVLASGISAGNDLAFLRRSIFAVSIHGSSERRIHELSDSTPSVSSKEHRLLEPFTKLHSIDRFNITGPVYGQYKAYITKQVARPAPSLESAIIEIMALKNEGKNAFNSNQHALAIAKYEAALLHLFTNFWDLDTIIQTGDLAKLKAYDACCSMRFQIQTMLAAALLGMKRFADCHYWASHAKSIREDRRTRARPELESYTKVAFIQVLASKGMGEIERAVWELREVVMLDQSHVLMKEQLAVLEREVEAMRRRGLTTFL